MQELKKIIFCSLHVIGVKIPFSVLTINNFYGLFILIISSDNIITAGNTI